MLHGGAFSVVGGILEFWSNCWILGKKVKNVQDKSEYIWWKTIETFDIASIIDQAKGLAANAASLVDMIVLLRLILPIFLMMQLMLPTDVMLDQYFVDHPVTWGGGGSGAKQILLGQQEIYWA